MLRALALSLAIAASATAADVTTLTGKKYTGTIAGIADGVVTVKTDSGPIAIPVKEMATVDFGAKPFPFDTVKHDELELIDSTILRVTGLTIPGRKIEPVPLKVDGVEAPVYAVPLESAFSWQRGAEDPKSREEWKKLLASRGKRDLFVVREGDRFSPVPGTILTGNPVGDAIEFERETDNTKVTFKLARATGGLVFNQPPRGVIPPTLCKLHDVFGNVLVVESLKLGESAEAKTVSGAVVSYSKLAALSKLDFSTGNIVYLSDREPTISAPPESKDKGTPQWQLLKDATIDGAGFKLREAVFAKGLQIPPEFVVTYKLNADYREFKAMAGIDDRIPELPLAARLTIEADGKAVFSELIRRTEKPKELTLDVKNVKLLTLRVDPDGSYAMCQIALADARLQK